MSRSGIHPLLMCWEEERRKAMSYFQKVDDSEPSVPESDILRSFQRAKLEEEKQAALEARINLLSLK